MELYVIRHGESEANAKGMHAGWSDVGLSERGCVQALKTRKELAGMHFERVYVSDLMRTRQTASLALPGYDFILDARIREFSSGTLAGQLIKDCRQKLGAPYEYSLVYNDYTPYGGENEHMVTLRIESFFKELERQEHTWPHPCKIAAVTHEGAVRHMIYYVLQSRFLKEHVMINNCSVIKFLYSSGVWQLMLG